MLEVFAATQFAEKLRYARKSLLSLTQAEFAKAVGTSQSGVAKWEKGEHRPLPHQIVKVARLLGGKKESLYFYKEAGVPDSFFENEKAPMPDVLIDATEGSNKIPSNSADTFQLLDSPEGQHRVPLLKNTRKLGDSKAVQSQDVESSLFFPPSWIPKGAQVQAVRFSQIISPFVSGDVIALVDISRRDPDRLAGSVVVVQTPTGKEPMTLRKDGEDYLLIPIKEEAGHPARIFRPRGSWSIIGKVLKWIGDAPTGRK